MGQNHIGDLTMGKMTTAIAWAYVRVGSLPRFSRVLQGIKPVVIAVVVQALFVVVIPFAVALGIMRVAEQVARRRP